MFKKQRNPKEEQENVFKQPRIKHSREIKTHLRERTPVERIFYLLKNQSRRETAFRMILALPPAELNRNIFMIADQVLNTLITDKRIEKSFFTVLTRLLKCEKAACLGSLCARYLQAQLSTDPEYLAFLEFLVRHFKSAIVGEKDEIARHIADPGTRNRVLSMAETTKAPTMDCGVPFYFIRRPGM